MAFTGNYLCTSFKVALLNGEMDFSSDTSQTFKIALFSSDATLDASTTAYSTTNEVSGTGYTAGGETLTISTNPTNTSTGTTAYLGFSDVTWTSSTLTARGALIYKYDNSTNPSGADKSSSASTFKVEFPTASDTNAIIRIAGGQTSGSGYMT
jgi:DnaJ-class molecular chaperone